MTDRDPSGSVLSAPIDLVKKITNSKEIEKFVGDLEPEVLKDLRELQQAAEHPAAQFAITLAKDPDFKDAALKLYQSHQHSTLLMYEILLVILFWVIRAWRLSKTSTWVQKLWVQAYLGIIFWFLVLLVLPYFVYQEPFKVVLSGLVKATIRHFL